MTLKSNWNWIYLKKNSSQYIIPGTSNNWLLSHPQGMLITSTLLQKWWLNINHPHSPSYFMGQASHYLWSTGLKLVLMTIIYITSAFHILVKLSCINSTDLTKNGDTEVGQVLYYTLNQYKHFMSWSFSIIWNFTNSQCSCITQ